jgi:hypothetical protein
MVVDLGELRWAGAGMLSLAAARPLWPDAADGVPCPFRAVTGIPCPLCGMTTSVCATVALRLGDAVTANPFGIVAVVVAIALLVLRARATVAFPPWLLGAGLAASQVVHLARV